MALDSTGIDSFPGPAVVVLADGTVARENAEAARLADVLRRGAAPELRLTVEQALASRRLRCTLLRLEGEPASVFLDLIVLPESDGRSALILGRDLSLDGHLRATLVESRQRYKDLVEISSDFAWETAADGTFAFVSPRGALGWKPADLVGRDAAVFMVGAPAGDSPFTTTRRLDELELRFRRADGGVAILAASCGPVLGRDGRWLGARGVCRDVTIERERDAALARSRHREALINQIVRATRDEVEPANMLSAAASAAAGALGARGCQVFRAVGGGFKLAADHRAADLAEPALVVLQGLGDAAELHQAEVAGHRLLATLTRQKGQVNGAVCLWREAPLGPWGEDDAGLLVEVANQIGIAIEQISNHEHIVELSRTDALTGLLNRRAFFADLARRFARLERDGEPAALVYVDLDNFKLVNDIHGHKRGDEALLALTRILKGGSRSRDLLARLGGDEFALWFEYVDEATVRERAERLLAESRRLAVFSGDPARPLGVSLGIAIYRPNVGESLDALLARADAAMYDIKRGGKGNYRVAPSAKRAG
ncbi:MAG: diguanylate cyclase [Proteobacteria bacterium]|nr:diguanylate cyclase [Pseudomonadota bacterium]